MYTFLNDEFVPGEKAFLHVNDLAIQRGYGIFDFFRVINNHPLFLADYLKRFFASAEVMRLEVPFDPDEFSTLLFELIDRNNIPMSGIKVILTGGYSPDGYQLSKPNLVIQQQPLSLSADAVHPTGVKVITHEYVRDMPHVKSINYLMGIWTYQKMLEQGASDVLYHFNGEVSEFPRCNFFIVRHDNTVVTPSKNILAGITRKHVLELAAKKYPVQEGTITLQELSQAREAFLTSTTKRIIPVTQIDDLVVGDGKPGVVTKALLEDVIQLEQEELVRSGSANVR
jgi:branched-chain amino acid aminotransferase